MHQRPDNRAQPSAIAGHHDGAVSWFDLKMHAAVVALMHTARHLGYELVEVKCLSAEGEIAPFQPPKLTQLGNERADASTRSFGFFEHSMLLVVERTRLFLE